MELHIKEGTINITGVVKKRKKSFSIKPVKDNGAADATSVENRWETAGFVYGVWAVMVVAAFALVYRYGSNVPYIDDWAMVAYITGSVRITPQYIWEQHNEHRVPVPKLILLGLYKLTGGDFRCGMYFNVSVLGGLAIVMIWVADRLRGRLIFADAFIPLLLLNWGHYEQILWSIEVQKSLSTFLIATAYMIMLLKGNELTPKAAVQISLCLVLLPLCGGYGMPFVVLMSGWIGCVGLKGWFSNESGKKRSSIVLVVLALISLGMVGLYFYEYRNQPGSSFSVPHPTLRAVVRTSLEVFSMGLGPMSSRFLWPYSMVMIIGMIGLGAATVMFVWYRQPSERNRALGVLFFLGAVTGLAIGIGKVRAGDNNVTGLGFENRYTTLMLPALYGIYLMGSAYYPISFGRFVQVGLFALLSPFFILNTTAGMEFAAERRAKEVEFLQDLKNGKPTYYLARTYSWWLSNALNQKEFADCLRMLRQANIGPYRNLNEGLGLREIKIALDPIPSSQITWDAGKGKVMNPNGHLDFTLTTPRFVAGIKIKIRYDDRERKPTPMRRPFKDNFVDDGSARLMITWKTTAQKDFVEVPWWDFVNTRFTEERYVPPEETEQAVTIWVADTIDRIRIHPDYPLWSPDSTERYENNSFKACAFTISEITLLTPLLPMWNHW